ncbi:C-type mannose receptor 2-like [Ptychodera flava]|uniref:C-type mannose receptor 2-like n=1 Tax=Ptychodera flava TaxID=63121 RepID=UPI00396A21AF
MNMLVISTVFIVLCQTALGLELFQEAKSHSEAEKSCEAKGMVLVLDSNSDMHSAILSLLSSNGLDSTDIWINGHQNCQGNWVDNKNKALGSYQPWANGEPNGSGKCLQLWAGMGHAWDDTPCSVTKPYVCDFVSPFGLHLFREAKSQGDAQATCEANGMTLVIDTNKHTHTAILSLLENNGYGDTDVWINGNQDGSGNWVTSDGDELMCYLPWQDGEPNGSGTCLQLWAAVGHAWDDTPCSDTKPFICGPADFGFKVFGSAKSHSEATSFCESQGMILALDSSPSTHSVILSMLDSHGYGSTDIWINGNQDDNGNWVDSYGDELTCYLPWQSGEPNGSGSCLQLWAGVGHKWDDTPCTVTKPYVCGPTE